MEVGSLGSEREINWVLYEGIVDKNSSETLEL